MTITNKYPGKCATCSCSVPVSGGTATKTSLGWQVSCSSHSGSTAISAPRAPSSASGRYPRRQLVNGDVYTSRRTGERVVFGCGDCSRLGRMCAQCRYDDE
jgi:hypothetical protein